MNTIKPPGLCGFGSSILRAARRDMLDEGIFLFSQWGIGNIHGVLLTA